MSLSTSANKVTYSGNGVSTSFSFTFPIPDASYLSVIFTDTAGVETTLNPTQYSVTGIGTTTGGAVTYPVTGSTLATGEKLTILRTVPYLQPTVLSNQNNYLPSVLELALDRLTMEVQQLAELQARALTVPPSDLTDPPFLPTAQLRINSALLFDANGDPYAGALASNLVGVSAYIANNVLPAVSAAAARTALGALGTADVYPLLRSYLAGLTLSAAGGTGTFGIAAGLATNSTNVSVMTLGSAYTKTTSAWALGTAAGGLDTGSIANSTWYHVYLIQRPDTGVVDVTFSTNASTPALPANYTLFRRIGAIKTDGSAHWTAFTQTGDLFQWATWTLDVNTTASASGTYTLNVPLGVAVIWQGTGALVGATDVGTVNVSLCTPGVTALTSVAALSVTNPSNVVFATAGGDFSVLTNTARAIGFLGASSGSATAAITLATRGWIDRRGRDT